MSVRSAAEAKEAICAGVDILDVKEPSRGSLGRAADSEIGAIAAVARSRLPLSVALGEAVELNEAASLPPGVTFFKAGSAGCASAAEYFRLCRFDERTSATGVVVAYADWRRAAAPSVDSLVETAAEIGSRWFLIDTHVKDGSTLFHHLPVPHATAIVQQLHRFGCRVALAGSLKEADVPRVLDSGADLIAVRGLVCRGSRTGRIAGEKIKMLKAQIVRLSSQRTRRG